MQHRERVVPCPDVSVLLLGKEMCAMLSASWTHPKVRLLASISLSIHQDEIIANRLEWQGLPAARGVTLSSTSRSLKKGSSVACLAGPRPRAAARDIRLKWRSKESGIDPCCIIISCRATAR